MKKLVLTTLVGVGMVVVPVAMAQNDMQRAIQFQRQKDAADARQAALEKQHPREQARSGASDQSADREDVNGYNTAPAKPTYRTAPTQSELAKAVAWEQQKDAAAARQASLEAHRTGRSK